MENSMAVLDVVQERAERAPSSLKWLRLYWISTAYVVLTSLMGGVSAILQAPALLDEVLRLGYPAHFSTLLGVWKVLGAAALTVPRRPLVKEWAYAGFFIDFSGAIVAYAAVGDGVRSFVGPVLAMSALIVSWHLRPSSRRLAGADARGQRLSSSNAD